MDPPEGYEFVVEDFRENFKWPEYIVFCAVLVASLGIGVFYGCFGTKNKSNEEFLMAGRSMSMTPVTLSLVCSFVSATTLLGNPVEVYYYGQVYALIAISFIPMTLALMYWYVPVFFSLQLTSAYEYFEWRYSRKVRTLCSIFAMIHLVFYQPITVLGPSLAIDQVAGFKYFISAGAIFIVCIAYSSLGGLKAVLWTDALQAVVMFVALGAVSIFGLIEVGGFAAAWEKSELTGRTNVLNFDPDLRTRHTALSATIGGYSLWLPLFAATQAQIQRYNSVPSLRESRLCLLFNMVGLMAVVLLCSFLGLLLYAKYADCNPMDTGAVTSVDQLLPLFVMDALRDYPVIPGLFVAGITCGSLSSVSSALNSLTALITEDFVKHYRPDWDDVKLGYVSKTVSFVSGFAAFGLLFVVKVVNETFNLLPFATLIHGALLGPILGAFSLAMFTPFSNDLGTYLGMLVSILVSGFVGIGNILEGRTDGKLPDQRLKLSVEGCDCILENDSSADIRACDSIASSWANSSIRPATNWKELHKHDSFALKVWSVSYIWEPGIGCVTTVIFGALFSFFIIAVNRKSIEKVHKNLLSKPWLHFWEKIFGKEKMSKWVDYSDEEAFRNKTNQNKFTISGGTPDEEDLKTDNNNAITLKNYEYGTIPKVQLNNFREKETAYIVKIPNLGDTSK